MADAAVVFVIEKLASSITQEVELLKGIHEEVVDIKGDLEAIQAFLQDADSKAEKEGISGGVKVWVKEAREAAYQAEDIIDKYMLHMSRNRDRIGFVGFLQKSRSLVKYLVQRDKLASEVQQIRKIVKEVRKRTEIFQLIPSSQGASSSNARNIVLNDPRLGSLSLEDAELVGIESPRDELINLLVNGTSRREVISAIGLGGIGKTTIGKKVFDHHIVKRHFECHAWITVSESYERKELLRRILKTFWEEKHENFPHHDIDTMNDRWLISKLREYLQGERYLIVFDDVWDVCFWEDVEHALLDNDKGSRILVTTRNEGVADFCNKSSRVHIHQMELLPHQEAWELFCKKAFRFELDGKCPADLVELSDEIVKRCGGLPLAIVAIGGLLATKEKTILEWRKFCDGFRSALIADPHLKNVNKILSLSYGDLPYHLKSCFLYLGMFPEDFPVRCKRLILLWVSLGFVQEKGGMTMEEVAEEYLTELIHRNLIQVGTVGKKGIPTAIRVHDMVREVILSKSEELSFCHVSIDRSTFGGIARHLSMINTGSHKEKSGGTKSQTRSTMIFNGLQPQKSIIDAIFTNSKLLTVLDFESCPIDHIPKELGGLLHLRYLNLRKTKVSKLPKSFGKLHNLESLDLRDSGVIELPVEINWFPKLRHLFGNDNLKIRGRIGQLNFLQTLYGIRVDDDVRLIKELGMLKQLRKLGIGELKREYGRDLCMSLEKMNNLRSLIVSSSSHGASVLEVQSMSSPPLNLQTLNLWGKLERLPEWFSKLDNLSKLGLGNSRLMDDPIKVLQALPNLKFLALDCGYKGEEMGFDGGGIQKLKKLYLTALMELNTIIIDEGAMPVLEVLGIAVCRKLKEVPSGIQCFKDLKELLFYWMSKEFTERLARDGGEDYWIVKHIPLLRYDGTYDPEEAAELRRYVELHELNQGFKREEIHFERGGFQKLKELNLTELMKLNTMIVDERAMPILEELNIVICGQLKEVPSGFQYLKDLKTLRFVEMLNEFTEKVSHDGGEDY